MPVLETERLVLRPFVEADLDEYAAMMAEPEVVRFLPLVRHVVFQVAVHFPRHVDREELATAGGGRMFALVMLDGKSDRTGLPL